MTETLKDRWADLRVELAKLRVEAELSGERAKAAVAALITDVEARAAQAEERLAEAAGAGSEGSKESLAHLEKSFEAAKTAVQDAWQQLR